MPVALVSPILFAGHLPALWIRGVLIAVITSGGYHTAADFPNSWSGRYARVRVCRAGWSWRSVAVSFRSSLRFLMPCYFSARLDSRIQPLSMSSLQLLQGCCRGVKVIGLRYRRRTSRLGGRRPDLPTFGTPWPPPPTTVLSSLVIDQDYASLPGLSLGVRFRRSLFRAWLRFGSASAHALCTSSPFSPEFFGAESLYREICLVFCAKQQPGDLC